LHLHANTKHFFFGSGKLTRNGVKAAMPFFFQGITETFAWMNLG